MTQTRAHRMTANFSRSEMDEYLRRILEQAHSEHAGTDHHSADDGQHPEDLPFFLSLKI